MIDTEKLKQAALAAKEGSYNKWEKFSDMATASAVLELITRLEAAESNQILGASASQFKEMEARLEAAELDATVGNWLCNYMAGQRVDLDDYLVGACHDDDPVKFKAAVLAAMKENK